MTIDVLHDYHVGLVLLRRQLIFFDDGILWFFEGDDDLIRIIGYIWIIERLQFLIQIVSILYAGFSFSFESFDSLFFE